MIVCVEVEQQRYRFSHLNHSRPKEQNVNTELNESSFLLTYLFYLRLERGKHVLIEYELVCEYVF